MQTLVGTIERIVFNNEENGYIIARFSVPKRYDLVTIVGSLADVHAGAYLRIWGEWKNHPVYGEQFVIEKYKEERPATVEGIRKYLGSGLIKGIGPVTATRIAEQFGTYTLDVIESEIERLTEVPGIGPKRLKTIAVAWEEQKSIKEIMLFLQSHNVSTRLAVKIYKTYGDDSIEVVQADPYRLAQDIYGIGFITADQIARNLGVEPESPTRLQAGLEHTLKTLADEGHVYVPQPHVLAEASKLLDVALERVESEIETLVREERIKLEQLQAEEPVAVYLTPFYWAEVGVTRRLKALQNQSASSTAQTAPAVSYLADFESIAWDKAFAFLKERDGVLLAKKQSEAVQTALTQSVCVLTGGPGTGKTTTVRSILRLLRAKRKRVLLAAPQVERLNAWQKQQGMRPKPCIVC